MATSRTNRVEVEIVATDEASPKIDKLEKKIDGLESDEARVIITSNINRLEEQLDAAQKKLDGLDGDEATVQARLVGNLESDLDQANKLFDQLDGKTGTVSITADTSDIQTAANRVDDLGRSAGSSKSALANMIGNTTQDVGALAGVAGGAGVAIGQMGEYMADARLEGEGFRSILKNFATVAGPIAGISVAIGLATKAWSDYKQKQKEAEEATRRTVDGLMKSLGLVGDLADTFGDAATAAEAFADILLGDEQDRDKTLGFLAELNLTLEDLPRLINAITTGDTQAIADLITELGGSDDAATAVAELVAEGEKLSALNSNATLIPWVEKFGEESAAAIFGISGLADEINGLQPNAAAGRFLDRIATSAPKARDAIADLREAMPNADNVEVLDAYVSGLEDVAGASRQTADLIADLNTQQERYVELLEASAGEADRKQRLVEQEQRHYDALRQVNDEHERVDRAAAIDDEKYKVAALVDTYEDLDEAISGERSLLRLQETLLRADEQFAKGGLTLREARIIQLDAQAATLDYLKTLEGIDPVIATQIVTKLDYGQFDRVSAQLETLGQPVTVPVKLTVNDDIPNYVRGLLSGSTPLTAPGWTAQTPGAPNVTIINPPGTPAQVVGSGNVYYSRNGVRVGP